MLIHVRNQYTPSVDWTSYKAFKPESIDIWASYMINFQSQLDGSWGGGGGGGGGSRAPPVFNHDCHIVATFLAAMPHATKRSLKM